MGLIVRYPLNGDLLDYVGDTVITNSGTNTFQSTGKIGSTYLKTDGAYRTNIQTLPNNFSIALWFKHNGTNWLDECLFGTNISTGGFKIYRDDANSNGLFKIYAWFYYNESSATVYNSIPTISGFTADTWYHIVMTRTSDGYLNFYRNGTIIYAGTPPGDFVRWKDTTDIDLTFHGTGDAYSYTSGSYNFNDIRIYDHILSTKEIKDLAKAKVLHYNFNTNIQPTENIYASCSKTFTESTTFPVDPPVKAVTGGNWTNLSWSGDIQVPGTFEDGDAITFSGYFMVHSSNIPVTGPGGDTYRLGLQGYSSRGSEGIILGNCLFNKWYYFEHTIEFDSTATSVRIEDGGYDNSNTTEAPYTTGYWCNVQVEKTRGATRYTETSRTENVPDNSGNGFEGTLEYTTSPQWSKDSILGSGCYQFDGTGTVDGVIPGSNIGVEESLTSTSNYPEGCSYSFWINVDTDAVDRMSLLYGRAWINHIEIYSTSKYFRTEAALQNGYSFGTGAFPDNVRGEWSHFVIVFANNETNRPVRWYQNSVLFHTGSMDDGANPGTEYFSFNKIGRSTGTTSYSYAKSFDGKIDDFRIYSSALTVSDIQELYQQRASIDSTGVFSTRELQETGHSPLILDYTTWTLGSGSAPGFNVNGDAAENERISTQDPWNKETIVWEARPDSAYGPDGGWNTSAFNIDNTKMYRFSTWVWRNRTGNGSFYLGCRGYGNTSGVYHRSTGSLNTNPYFTGHQSPPEAGRWELMVGHVWPAGSGTGSFHEDSGRYTVESGRVADIINDFVWHADTTTSAHRSYLYYCTDPSVRQHWVYPRVDIIDGSEPSIEDLLAGFDSNYYNYIYAKGGTSNVSLDVGSATTKVGKISEVGYTEKMAVWYPLQGPLTSGGDAYELVNRNDGTLMGSPSVSLRGYEFASVDDKIVGFDITDIIDSPTNAITFSAWINRTGSNNSNNMFMGQFLPYFGFASSNTIIFSALISGTQRTITTSETFSNGTWYHTTFTYDGLNMRIYVDGVLKTTSSDYSGGMSPSSDKIFTIGDGVNGSNWFPFVGKVSDVRIFDKVLTAEDVEILYKTTNPESTTRGQVSKNTFYSKNHIIEN
jgi:hypothetical protein